jgi:hypothetical protein
VYLPSDKRGNLFKGEGFLPVYTTAPSLMTTGKKAGLHGSSDASHGARWQPQNITSISPQWESPSGGCQPLFEPSLFEKGR